MSNVIISFRKGKERLGQISTSAKEVKHVPRGCFCEEYSIFPKHVKVSPADGLKTSIVPTVFVNVLSIKSTRTIGSDRV